MKLLSLMSLCSVHGGPVDDLIWNLEQKKMESLSPIPLIFAAGIFGGAHIEYKKDIEVRSKDIPELIETIRKGEAARLAQPAHQKEMQSMKHQLEQLIKTKVELSEQLSTLKIERDSFKEALEAVGIEKNRNTLELESTQAAREEEIQKTILAMQEQIKQLTGINTLQTENQELKRQLLISESKCEALMQAFKTIKSVNSSTPPIIPTPQDGSPAARSGTPSEAGSSKGSSTSTWHVVPSV